MQLTASGGTRAVPLDAVGKLPRGLKWGGGLRGTITGTPKKLTGTFTFQVQVKDSTKPKGSATKTLSIAVSSPRLRLASGARWNRTTDLILIRDAL